jgi:hypothetical protein
MSQTFEGYTDGKDYTMAGVKPEEIAADSQFLKEWQVCKCPKLCCETEIQYHCCPR